MGRISVAARAVDQLAAVDDGDAAHDRPQVVDEVGVRDHVRRADVAARGDQPFDKHLGPANPAGIEIGHGIAPARTSP